MRALSATLFLCLPALLMAFLAPVTRIQSSSTLAINTVPKAHDLLSERPIRRSVHPHPSCLTRGHLTREKCPPRYMYQHGINSSCGVLALYRNRGMRWMSEESDAAAAEEARKLDLSNNMRSRKG